MPSGQGPLDDRWLQAAIIGESKSLDENRFGNVPAWDIQRLDLVLCHINKQGLCATAPPVFATGSANVRIGNDFWKEHWQSQLHPRSSVDKAQIELSDLTLPGTQFLAFELLEVLRRLGVQVGQVAMANLVIEFRQFAMERDLVIGLRQNGFEFGDCFVQLTLFHHDGRQGIAESRIVGRRTNRGQRQLVSAIQIRFIRVREHPRIVIGDHRKTSIQPIGLKEVILALSS